LYKNVIIKLEKHKESIKMANELKRKSKEDSFERRIMNGNALELMARSASYKMSKEIIIVLFILSSKGK